MYRPKQFDDYRGQTEVVDALRIKVKASKKTGEPLAHTLMLGPSGLGKTTLSVIMASELGANIHQVMATRINSWKSLLQLIKSLKTGDILFIDEIHALKPAIQEELYGVMEDFSYNEYNTLMKEMEQVPVPKFTLIGATTDTGQLNVPLLMRFPNKVMLQPYSVEELTKVVQNSCYRTYNVFMPEDIAKRIAQLSRSTPRNANNLLRNLFETANGTIVTDINSNHLTTKLLAKTLRGEKQDPIIGLDYASRKYLVALYDQNSPLGAKVIATMINEKEETVSSMIEPFLLSDIVMPVYEKRDNLTYARTGTLTGPFVKVTRMGRVLTDMAHIYLATLRQMQKDLNILPNERLGQVPVDAKQDVAVLIQ